MVHTANYYDTFIAVAEDCSAKEAETPPDKEPKSVACAQYEMLINKPYEYTSDDVIYETNGRPKGLSREQFFSKGQPCFRSSPLTKRYGWGVHSDDDGKIALYGLGSDEYARHIADSSLKQLKAMRSKRA